MENDVEIGRRVLRAFWQSSKTYSPNFYPNFDDFLNKLQPSPTKLRILLDGIGLGVRSANISNSRIELAMRTMAAQARGRLPSSNMDFFKYLQDQAIKINYLDAAVYVASESSKQIVTGAAAVGDSLITAGKTLNFFLPAILVIGALVFVFSWFDKTTGGKATHFVRAFK